MKKLFYVLFLIAILSVKIIPQPAHSFTAAFDSLHQKLSTYYAFTDLKKINWNSLYNEFQPRIATAEIQNDSSAFLMALKEYVFSIPDAHVGLSTGFYPGLNTVLITGRHTNWVKLESKLRDEQIGGSYGFTLIKLDDGRFVVKLIIPGSPADSAGIKFGAEILEINDKPVLEAVNSTGVIWAEQIPATNEAKQLYQCRLIGRAPVGASIKIQFKNKDVAVVTTKTIIAVNDNYESFDSTSMYPLKSPEISYKILQPSGFGYLEITSCIPPINVVTDFMSAFISLLSENIKGLVVDLRINTGGLDAFAAAVAGCFYPDTTFYEYQSFYDPASASFKISDEILNHLSFQSVSFFKPTQYPAGSIYIEPQGLTFNGPIVVMVGPRNVSSGEGIAMALQNLPQCKVVSFYGTHGSFGITAKPMNILSEQDSLELSYPDGRSLDVNKKIQVDSDSNMVGGVIPDIRPPLNDQTIDEMLTQGIDVELEYAIQELNKMVTGIDVKDQNDKVPAVYLLNQNYPNPFNPTTTIKYSIPRKSFVTIIIYDVLGKKIATLVNDEKSSGNYSIIFNADRLTSGIYFYRMQAGVFSETKKFIVLK